MQKTLDIWFTACRLKGEMTYTFFSTKEKAEDNAIRQRALYKAHVGVHTMSEGTIMTVTKVGGFNV